MDSYYSDYLNYYNNWLTQWSPINNSFDPSTSFFNFQGSYSSPPMESPIYPMTPSDSSVSFTPSSISSQSPPGTGTQTHHQQQGSFSSPPMTPSDPFVSVTPSSTSSQSPSETRTHHQQQRTCTNCGVNETCRWRNVTTNITCNACFTYFRKYKKQRPDSAKVAYQARKEHQKLQTCPY